MCTNKLPWKCIWCVSAFLMRTSCEVLRTYLLVEVTQLMRVVIGLFARLIESKWCVRFGSIINLWVIYGHWINFYVWVTNCKNVFKLFWNIRPVSGGFYVISWKIEYCGYHELGSKFWSCYNRFHVILVQVIAELHCNIVNKYLDILHCNGTSYLHVLQIH